MKITKHIFATLLFGALITGCANSDDYSAPNMACQDATEGLTANISGNDIYAMANSSMQTFSEEGEDYLEAYITSSDQGGNFFKTISMETADGKGLSIAVDMYNTYTKGFNTGRKVFIKLNGLKYQIAHNSLLLGQLYTNPSSGNQSVGRISENKIDDIILKSCEIKAEEELVHYVNVQQAKTNNMINKLIEIVDVEFVEMGLPYYDANNVIGGSTNRNIRNAQDQTVIFRTGSYATYAGDVIPAKSGSVRGVMTKYNSDFQFIARDREDIKLINDPLTEPEPEQPEVPTDPTNLAFAGADFNNWSVFNSAINSYGLKPYAVQGVGTGVNGSNSLHLNGTPTANDYVFTINASAAGTIPATPTKITFWIKGTSAKSLSLNVYRSTTGYDVFNVGDLTGNTPVTLYKANLNTSGNGTNAYTGAINTNGGWTKITLDISDVQLNTTGTGDLFALKVGNSAAYDLHIDNIEIQ